MEFDNVRQVVRSLDTIEDPETGHLSRDRPTRERDSVRPRSRGESKQRAGFRQRKRPP